jgi:hypothetical protein
MGNANNSTESPIWRKFFLFVYTRAIFEETMTQKFLELQGQIQGRVPGKVQKCG